MKVLARGVGEEEEESGINKEYSREKNRTRRDHAAANYSLGIVGEVVGKCRE